MLWSNNSTSEFVLLYYIHKTCKYLSMRMRFAAVSNSEKLETS